MDSTELLEQKEAIAFAREEAAHDRNIRGVSLVLGAAPTAGLMARLLQATQGYNTGTQLTNPPPGPGGGPSLPKILQDLLDAGIQDVLGLINWLTTHGLLPSPQQIAPFIQSLIDAGVNDVTGLVKWLEGNRGTPAPTPSKTPEGGPTIWNRFGPFAEENDKIAAIAAAGTHGATKDQLNTASWAYFVKPVFGASGWYLTVYP